MLRREKTLELIQTLAARGASRSRPEILHLALRTLMPLVEAEGAVLSLASNRQVEHVSQRGTEPPVELSMSGPPSEFARTLALSGLPRVFTDLSEVSRSNESDRCPGLESGPALYVPFRLRENEWGWAGAFRSRDAARFTSRDARQMALLVAWLATAVESQRLAENLEKLAVTDDLTQVYNYRYLKTALRREIKRAGRYRQSLSLIMIDVDNLKAYNDRNGHIRGSFLLKEIAQLFASQVRSWDLVAKYGGDEFTVILPQTERHGAVVVAERLRASVEAHAFPLAPRASITVSSGVSVFPEDGDSSQTLIEAADRALYLAKRRGRNRVESVESEAA